MINLSKSGINNIGLHKVLICFLCFFVFLLVVSSKEKDKVNKPTFSLSLNGVPPVRSIIRDFSKRCGYVLLSTRDYDCKEGSNNLSVQIIDPLHSWPPLWFVTLKCAGAELTDAKVLENGNISFYVRDPNYSFKVPKNKLGINEAMLEGYIQLDSFFNFREFFASIYMGTHDYRVLPDGRRIYLKNVSRKMNLSNIIFQGKKLGTSVLVNAEQIEIVDSLNNLVFQWYPLDHLKFSEMYYEEYADIISHSEKLDQFSFIRLNSVGIDPFDGNLLVSYKRLDVCLKIDINSGNIIWRLGGKKNDFSIDSADHFYLQHDFRRIAEGPFKGKFTLFSNGSSYVPHCEGIVLDLDEENKIAKVVKRYRPMADFMSNGKGNFQVYPDETSFINFGDKGSIAKIPHFSYVDSFQKVLIDFYSDQPVTTFRVTCEKFPEIKRPIISCDKKNGKIVLTAHGNFDFFQWSTGDTTSSITVVDTGAYYVVGQLGIGGSPSEFFHINDLESFNCPASFPYRQETYQYHKVQGKKEPKI